MSSPARPSHHAITLSGEAATARLAAEFAALAKPGDIVCLGGELGTGKSTFARAFIRSLLGDPAIEVPSPTFTLVQEYAGSQVTIVHADLFRLGNPDEFAELGLLDRLDETILLVEWPDRAGSWLEQDTRIDLIFTLDPAGPDDERMLDVIPGPAAIDRVHLALATRDLLAGSEWAKARRTHLQGDASSRAYERLVMPDGRTAILMVSPPRPDGPPVRAGKPYSAIARLAETIHAFVAIDRGLRAIGLSAPKIYAQDLDTGLLLIEDFGSGVVVDNKGPIPERYEAAAQLLAEMHRHHLPTILPVTEGRDHVIPDYDLDAMEIETELLLDWYAPHVAGATLPAVARSAFRKAFRPLLEMAIAAERSWVLRDYHSPNLIWLPKREGLAKVGVIDFQDAVLGPTAYDLVSLGQDARVTVSPELEIHLLAAYTAARRAQAPDFDAAALARIYAVMGAQRATKILGIFARLDKRDGKPVYLRHLPRVEDYLRRNLAHPDLAELAGWYRTYLPALLAESA